MTETQKRNDTFSDRLKALIEERKKNGQTLRELAKDLDVSLGVLSDWQNGNKTPRGDSIIKLAQYFEVSADYLLGLTGAKTVDTDLRMVAEYTGLSEEAIQRMKEVAPTHILEIISKMLEQDVFLQLAWKIYDFREAARGAAAWEKKIKHELELAKKESEIAYYKKVHREIGEDEYLWGKIFEWCKKNKQSEMDFLKEETLFENEEIFKEYRKWVDSLGDTRIAENNGMVLSYLKDMDMLEYQATRLLTVPMDEMARECGIDDMKRIKARSMHDIGDELRNQSTVLAEKALDAAGDAPEDTAPKKD